MKPTLLPSRSFQPDRILASEGTDLPPTAIGLPRPRVRSRSRADSTRHDTGAYLAWPSIAIAENACAEIRLLFAHARKTVTISRTRAFAQHVV